jgi:hypothetical protein
MYKTKEIDFRKIIFITEILLMHQAANPQIFKLKALPGLAPQ